VGRLPAHVMMAVERKERSRRLGLERALVEVDRVVVEAVRALDRLREKEEAARVGGSSVCDVMFDVLDREIALAAEVEADAAPEVREGIVARDLEPGVEVLL